MLGTLGAAQAQVDADQGQFASLLTVQTPKPHIDPLITGSTEGQAPAGFKTPKIPLDVLCDRECQIQRFDMWKHLLDEE
ncbi:MAG: hypothetical protein AAGI92_02510 [Pseudomonadota bacterium]